MHVVMMVPMMVVIVMMMMVHHRRRFGRGRCPGRSGGRRFLRDSVTGEAERERGRDDKTLDHRGTFLWLGNPSGSPWTIESAA
jgi:hypothetical protein